MKPLLLLVDLQRDFLATPGLEPGVAAVVARAEALLAGARVAGAEIVHVWTSVSREDDRRMPHWRREGRWLCELGTPGHQPPPALEPRPDEPVIHKTGFNPFAGGELDRLLEAARPEPLVIAGVHLHGCVRQAVLEAYERHRVAVWVAADATATDDPVHGAITRRYLERRAARFLEVEQVLDRFGSGAPARLEADGELRLGALASRAREALPEWQKAGPVARAALLERAAELLAPRATELAEAMAIEIGKPIRYGAAEVRRSAEMLRAVARRASARDGGEAAGPAEVRRRPLGVIAVITPWNNPVYIPLGKIAAALAHGNAALWKPSPAAQGIAERIVAVLERAGAPAGLVGLVAGGPAAAKAVMSEPSVEAVTITGSSEAGFAAQEACARRRIPLQAELGGNNAAVVWPDADLPRAARELAEGAFALAGQRCTANRRIVAHRACRDELVELLQRETAALEWGDPRREATRVGPLVSATARDRVAGLVERAAADGAGVIVPHDTAGAAPARGFDGAWYPPTIVCCDEPGHEIVQGESFGPVAVVQTADDWEGALALVNAVPQGLVAAIFSSSRELAARFADEAAVGIVKVDRSTADADVDVPFGGWKSSGLGPPEHGAFDRDFYTRPQAIYR
ncbi:MAG: aldehyde dehydrogenase family protein [Solirubrobacterales bacterium]